MNLRSQFLLIITGFLLLQGMIFFAYYVMMVLPRVDQLEFSQAEKNAQRSQNILSDHLIALDDLNDQWSRQKMLHQSLETGDTKTIEHLFSNERLKDESLNLLYLLDEHENTKLQLTLDPSSDEPYLLLDFIPKLKSLSPGFLSKESHDINGVFFSERGPMEISSKRLSNENGKPIGTLILGRFFTQALTDSFSRTTRADVTLWPLGVKELPESIQTLTAVIEANPKHIHLEQTANTIKAYTKWSDISGRSSLVLMTTTPRNVSSLFISSMKQAYAVLLLVNFILVMGLLKIIQHAIITPTKNLTDFVKEVALHIDAPPRIKSSRKDEIGILTERLNELIIEFCDYKNKALSKAFQFGMDKAKIDIVEDLSNTLKQLIPLVENYEKRLWTLSLDDLERLLAELQFGSLDEAGLERIKQSLVNYHIYLRTEIQAHRKQVRTIKEKTLRTATLIKSYVLHMRHTKTFTLIQGAHHKKSMRLGEGLNNHDEIR